MMNALRYFVQDFFLGGYLTTKPSSEWLSTMTTPQTQYMMMGDFLDGADYDLISSVYPIINTQNDPRIRNAEIRVDAGFTDINKMARVRFANLEPYLNKNTSVYNGTFPSYLQLNPWNEQINFNNATNGLQFPPSWDAESVLFYDNRLMRTFNLTDSGNTVSGTYNEKT